VAEVVVERDVVGMMGGGGETGESSRYKRTEEEVLEDIRGMQTGGPNTGEIRNTRGLYYRFLL
jgi:hypothetical protein